MKVWLAQVEDYDDHSITAVATTLDGVAEAVMRQHPDLTEWVQERCDVDWWRLIGRRPSKWGRVEQSWSLDQHELIDS